MQMEAMVVRTWGLRSTEFGDALGGRDQLELRDALGGCDQATLEMHLEAMIMRT